MSRLRTLFLALLLAAAPLMAEAGFDGHAHHRAAQDAPADHAPDSHGDAAAAFSCPRAFSAGMATQARAWQFMARWGNYSRANS